MAKINFLLLLSATTQLHQALILNTPFVQRLTVAGTYLICWAAGVEGVLCETFENIIPRELLCGCRRSEVLYSLNHRHACLIMGQWAFFPLNPFPPAVFLRGRTTAVPAVKGEVRG